MKVKQVGVCAHDKRPLLTSCLAASGRSEKGREKERGDGGRIEGHTRQWGLCGHLSATNGKAVDPVNRNGSDSVCVS